jgi:phage terminase large subunit-like protein
MLPVDDVDYASYNPQTGFRHNMIKFKSGSTVSFRSYDQEQKRWQGWTGHGILLDEEPPWDIYQECTARVAKNNGFIIGTMTSMSGYSRLVEEVVFSGKVRCYFIETYENSTENGGALTPDALKRLESEIEEKDRDARLRGIPTPKTGLVFEGVRLEAPFLVPYEKEWEPKKNLPTVVSLDPHPKIPHAAVWIQIDTGGGLWVVKERPWLAEEGSKALSPWVTPAILAHEIGQFNRGLTIENVLIDKFACHTTNIETGSNFQAVLANLGLFTLDAGGDVQNKIVLMQQLIRQKKIHIFESCWNLLWEIKRYVWEDHISRKTAERREVKQKPRKKDDHLIDCLMNAILYIHTTGLNRTNFPTGTLVRNPTGAESLDKKDMFNNPGQSDPILMEYYQ